MPEVDRLLVPHAAEASWSRVGAIAIPTAFVLATFALASNVVPSADTWWHLAAGRWILQHRAIPHQDPFSFSAAGKPWIAHEYLFEILMFWLHRWGGFAALTLANAVLLMMAFWLVAQCIPGRRTLAYAVTLLAVCSAHPAFALRPQSVSIFFGAAFLWIIHKYFQDHRARRFLLLPCLMLLWVNFHAGYLLGIALVVALGGGQMLDRLVHRETASPRTWSALVAAGIACVAVIPLNPNGFEMLRYPFDVMRMKTTYDIIEWQPPRLTQPAFYPFIVLAALAFFALVSSERKYRPSQFLVYGGALFAALHSARNVPVFSLIAVPLIVEHLRIPDWKAWQKFSPTLRTCAAALLLLLSLTLSVKYTVGGVKFQVSAEHDVFPQAALTYLSQHRLPANVLNDYAFGGYMIWRLYPDYKVYIDGRADLYGDAFVAQYLDMYRAQYVPDAFLQNANVNTVILSPSSYLGTILKIEIPANRWHIAYQDSVATIFVRGSDDSAVAQNTVRALHPEQGQ